MKLIKRVKYGLERGVKMVIKGIKEIISIVPCDKKLVVDIAKDVILAVGGATALGAVLIINDLKAYSDRMENGEYLR